MMMAVLGACRDEPRDTESSAMKFQRMLDAAGERIVVRDAQGSAVAKFRKRNAKYKVYDETLAPVGFVNWEKHDAGVRVYLNPLDGDGAERIEQASEDKFKLGDRVRIERADHGWAVFGKGDAHVGVFEKGDGDTWTLRPAHGPAYKAKRDGRTWMVTQGEQTVIELRARDMERLEVLALRLDGLPMLERVAVGVWMARGRR